MNFLLHLQVTIVNYCEGVAVVALKAVLVIGSQSVRDQSSESSARFHLAP